jgi:hypothetical protein
MAIIETAKTDIEKLVEDIPIVSLDIPIHKKPPTKKRIRRIAEPHIRGHQVKGRVYYYYVRGMDKEVYLGNADAILQALNGGKKRLANITNK